MSDHDALREEAAMATARRQTEIPRCTCGREYDAPEDIDLRPCPSCDEDSCSDCRHLCDRDKYSADREQCGEWGCEGCMEKFEYSTSPLAEPLWFCHDCFWDGVDPYSLYRRAKEDKANMAAAVRQYTDLLDPVHGETEAARHLLNEAIDGLCHAAELYLGRTVQTKKGR